MKNKEKYAKQIVDILLEGWHFALNEDGKIASCCDTKCMNCLFNVKQGCNVERTAWANAEYEEPKQFTDREKAFIKLFPEIKYLARDDEGKLFAYRQKPFKDEEEGWWTCDDDTDILFEISSSFGDFLKFKSIQWEDEEPTSREEILGEE